jgi:hypothetical protein
MSEPTAPTPAAPPNPQSQIHNPQSFPTTDLALLEAFLAHGLSPSHLSAAINDPLSTLDILAWVSQPHIAAALAAVRQLATTAASIRHARARFDAIDALARLTSSPDPITQRLAATTILRRPRNRNPLPAAGRAGEGSAKCAQPKHPTALPLDASPAPSDSYTPPTAHTPPAPEDPAHRDPAAILQELEALLHQQASPDNTGALDDDNADAPKPDKSDNEDDHPLSPQEQEGELALQFFESLDVPLTHPDIIQAIGQGRIRDLPSIAGTIRASRVPP